MVGYEKARRSNPERRAFSVMVGAAGIEPATPPV